MPAENIVIDDSNYQAFLNPIVNGQRKLTGYEGMFPDDLSRGSVIPFSEQDEIPLIPLDEIDDRLRTIEKDNTRMDQMALDMKLSVLDQDGTNYCWGNSPVFCAMLYRMQEMMREFRLSPASVCCPIVGGNQGGFGVNAVKFMVEYGCNEQSVWAPNRIDRSLWTPENKQLALSQRVLKFIRIETKQEEDSCMCARVPVSGGYNWWRHQVTTVHRYAGKKRKRIANSWGQWGQYGYGDLDGSKADADDMVAILSMQPL